MSVWTPCRSPFSYRGCLVCPPNWATVRHMPRVQMPPKRHHIVALFSFVSTWSWSAIITEIVKSFMVCAVMKCFLTLIRWMYTRFVMCLQIKLYYLLCILWVAYSFDKSFLGESVVAFLSWLRFIDSTWILLLNI